jgi:hypothetical protein
MIRRYRKKPIQVEAVQWDGQNGHEIATFINGSGYYVADDQAWHVGTLGHLAIAYLSDFIYRQDGNFWVCTAEQFAREYE